MIFYALGIKISILITLFTFYNIFVKKFHIVLIDSWVLWSTALLWKIWTRLFDARSRHVNNLIPLHWFKDSTIDSVTEIHI